MFDKFDAEESIAICKYIKAKKNTAYDTNCNSYSSSSQSLSNVSDSSKGGNTSLNNVLPIT